MLVLFVDVRKREVLVPRRLPARDDASADVVSVGSASR